MSTTTAMPSAQKLTRDPISVILPFLTLNEFATTAALISRVWYYTAQTMPKRHDHFILYDYSPSTSILLLILANDSSTSSAKAELLTHSSLRQHITHLTIEFSSIVLDTKVPLTLTVVQVDTDRNTPPPPLREWDFSARVNAITQAMPHLTSLALTAEICWPDEDGSKKILPVKLPPHLRRLGLTLKFPDSFGEMLCGALLGQMFEEMSSSPSICASLRILECRITPSDCLMCVINSLPHFSALRRLVLASAPNSLPLGPPSELFDAVRTLPHVTEFEYWSWSDLHYLLQEPSTQYHRIGVSSLRAQSNIMIGITTEFDSPLNPEILLASSRDSLTELNAGIQVSLSFLPELNQLRVLRLRVYDTYPHAIENGHMDAVNAVSQCRMLERLHLDWSSRRFGWNETHVEVMVSSLLYLEYLILGGQHQIHSLDFFRRSHLRYGLKYFSFSGRLSSLSSYRAIYSLAQLRLLNIDTIEVISLWGGSAMDNSNDGISTRALDAMFRPRHQVGTSVVASFTSSTPEYASVAGISMGASGFGGSFSSSSSNWNTEPPKTMTLVDDLGQLPTEHLTHLRNFSQSKQREKEEEWRKLADEVEEERVAQMMRQE